ncbi:LacI family DNA-binding transcriptional regulator [Isoptericola sp. NPDC057653]|uniref:LacI family DNA-binding transcriptional regulator n=1 Tax=Isoptericola sp. NPDC057653 TaxID=3346195 RepID=UPI0036A2940E
MSADRDRVGRRPTSGSQPSGSPTARDVAAAAGVSPRTVSNVVTGAVAVRAETRRRVEDAIAALGYRPNLAARRLRSGRSQVIGLVLPDVTVPYFRDLADAVLVAAARAGFSVVVEQTRGELARERAVWSNPRLRHVDGIVMASVELGPAELATMGPGRPMVVAGVPVRSDAVASVSPDNAAAGRSVARLLWDRGSRRPAVIVPGDTRWSVESDDRYRGFVDEMSDRGISVGPDDVVVTTTVTLPAGAEAARALLSRTPSADAVFAIGDALALGALHAAHEAGRSVPDDLLVAGFGNVGSSAYSSPTLTTVDTDREAIARESVAVIVEALGRAGTASPERRTVRHRLVERESTRARA